MLDPLTTIIQIFLIIYTAACALQANIQPPLLDSTQLNNKSNRATAFVHNLSLTIVFVLLSFTYELNALTATTFIFIVLHHLIRALNNLYHASEDVWEPSDREIYLNMIIYVLTVFAVPVVLL